MDILVLCTVYIGSAAKPIIDISAVRRRKSILVMVECIFIFLLQKETLYNRRIIKSVPKTLKITSYQRKHKVTWQADFRRWKNSIFLC